MNKTFIIFILAVLFLSIDQSKASPPSPFIDAGACPFECCKYGEWVAKKDIELKDQINGKTVISKIKSGEKINALTAQICG